MSEEMEVTRRQVGYSWSYTLKVGVDKEEVTPAPGTRASQTKTNRNSEEVAAGGNTLNLSDTMRELLSARGDLRKLLGVDDSLGAVVVSPEAKEGTAEGL